MCAPFRPCDSDAGLRAQAVSPTPLEGAALPETLSVQENRFLSSLPAAAAL